MVSVSRNTIVLSLWLVKFLQSNILELVIWFYPVALKKEELKIHFSFSNSTEKVELEHSGVLPDLFCGERDLRHGGRKKIESRGAFCCQPSVYQIQMKNVCCLK